MDVGCHVLVVIVVFWLSFFGCLVFGNSVFFGFSVWISGAGKASCFLSWRVACGFGAYV